MGFVLEFQGSGCRVQVAGIRVQDSGRTTRALTPNPQRLMQSRSVGFVLDWANRSIFRQAVTRFPEVSYSLSTKTLFPIFY